MWHTCIWYTPEVCIVLNLLIRPRPYFSDYSRTVSLSLLTCVLCQENVEHLEQVYVDFETTQREVVIWLDNAEDILRELDQLNQDAELSDHHINKFKVGD